MLLEEIEGEEQIQSDANEASSEPEQSEQASPAVEKSAQETKPKDTETPFHLHPRWIERDNELKAERQARQQLEGQMRELQTQFQSRSQPAGPDKRTAMIERLKGIDPEFAEFVSQMAPAKDLEELRAWKQAQSQERDKQTVYSEIDKLHTANKVEGDLKDRYRESIENAIRSNPHAQMSDLPAIYKQVHESYSKWIDGIKRSERESYLKAKTSAASAPATQTKGKAVKANSSGTEWSKDPEAARAQLIKRVVSSAKSGTDL